MEQKDLEKRQKMLEAKTNSILLGNVLKECIDKWDIKAIVDEKNEEGRKNFKENAKDLYKIYKEIYKELRDEGENL